MKVHRLAVDLAKRLGVRLGRFRPLAHDSMAAQKSLYPRPQLIFDVGAHHGDVTAAYLAAFPSANVQAFEPAAGSYGILQRRFADEPRVMTHRQAMAATAGQQLMNINSDSATNSLLRGAAGVESVQTISQQAVQCVRLDDLDECPDILKLDVQGSELDAIAGGEQSLHSGRIQLVFAEVWFNQDYVGAPLFHHLATRLDDLGYYLHGLYDLKHLDNGRLWFGDALFVRKARSLPKDDADKAD